MILNVNKPVGWTSFDVVRAVRRLSKEKKVGHGGTLDPFATGVLIIGTGRDTKELARFSSGDKSYLAVLKLGQATTTLDPEGEVVERVPVPVLDEKAITSVLAGLQGIQLQTPPMFSAKKVQGVRLYRLARTNRVVDRDPVTVHIRTLELVDYSSPLITFSTTCSSGTYVRVLGSEIARTLGSVGHLVALTRTRVAEFTLETARTPDQLEAQWSSITA